MELRAVNNNIDNKSQMGYNLSMTDLKGYIPEIVESLKELDPFKIYMFGSVAKGTDNQDSDIDLAVILNIDDVPKTYDEKLKNKVSVRNSILDISMEVPIDLLVYTKEEFKILDELNKPFMTEITEKGTLIYEQVS
ncbi:nucleotidyltransferase domain-containing protein [Thiospirochaeta perfilievii]|uniref:Nucleotidyltransferase domain-containing protein n=2 Tax=Thiospirochaeta perfilievii TaxID=252967 RepID=A0A5C1QD82_9SPIO|nr:nucleotidyltransferase domain-containing protein [Thiospirochaeta perfilievii]